MSVAASSKEDISVVTADSAGDESQYLIFTLRKEMFAIGILNIKEILEYGQLTTVPMMPGYIRGVINLRGAVVPVVDLSARFGDKQSDVSKRTCIVITEVASDDGRHDIGVMVDAFSEVLEISNTEIEPPPNFGARIRADFIAGMGKVNSKFVVILNVDNVLSIEELALVREIEKN